VPTGHSKRSNTTSRQCRRRPPRSPPRAGWRSWADVLDGLIAPIYIRQLFGMGEIDAAMVTALVKRTISFAAR
jgi:hypothetical protein